MYERSLSEGLCRSASRALTDYSQVDILGTRYKSVNFRVGKSRLHLFLGRRIVGDVREDFERGCVPLLEPHARHERRYSDLLLFIVCYLRFRFLIICYSQFRVIDHLLFIIFHSQFIVQGV